MKYQYYDKKINKKTTGRYDITPLFEDSKVFSNLVNDLVKPFKGKFNKVVGLDALGFILGGAIANKCNVGFVPVRKGGKLPGTKKNILGVSAVDYSKTKKVFEMNKGSICKKDRVLIVDDWIETGKQVNSAIKLIEKQGGKVIGITTLVIDDESKIDKKYNVYSIERLR